MEILDWSILRVQMGKYRPLECTVDKPIRFKDLRFQTTKKLEKKMITNFKHRHAKRARVIFLVIGSRSIRRTVHSNDLVKFFGGL